jgi:hypothetical protein
MTIEVGWGVIQYKDVCKPKKSGLKACLVVDISISGIVLYGYTVTDLVTQLMASPVSLK